MKTTVFAIVVSVMICAMAGAAEKPEAEPLATGEFGVRHLAFSFTGHMYLDGPAKQAACPHGRPGAGRSDDDGNVWFGMGGGATTGIGGRCLIQQFGVAWHAGKVLVKAHQVLYAL